MTQMHKAGMKMLFFGDETWLKLFPNQFERFDGTNSFFVTDYTEVKISILSVLMIVAHEFNNVVFYTVNVSKQWLSPSIQA